MRACPERVRVTRVTSAFGVALVALLAGASSLCAAATISEFPVTPAPLGITAGPDGNLWFVQGGGTVIGRITPAGHVDEFPVAGAAGGDADFPLGIALGADGNLWFGDTVNNAIGRITPSGAITEFPLPVAQSLPQAIAAGPDGNLWFTEQHKVGRITPAGVITEFAVPDPAPGTDNGTVSLTLGGIAAGADGNLWFTVARLSGCGIDACNSVLGYASAISTNGTIKGQFALPGTHVLPANIAAGADGNLWITEYQFEADVFRTGGSIARVGTNGTVATFALPTAGAVPSGIAAGPDGALWFAESRANQIGRITTSGDVTEFGVLNPNSQPSGIAKGPDGNLWFTEHTASAVAQLVPNVAPSPPIRGYTSGNWYIPGQSGHGFQIEVTTTGQMIVVWFVYTPDGSGQTWIYAQGPYDPNKNSVTLPAEILTGAKFPPNFNPGDVHAQGGGEWGTLTFTFDDCSRGSVRWHSDLPGYALANDNGFAITRLTQIAGTVCPP